MITGKEYLDGINAAIKEDVDTELQRLQYFIKANARVRNTRYPLIFSVKNCSWETIEALAEFLEENHWLAVKDKEYIKITPTFDNVLNRSSMFPPPLPNK